MSRVGLVLGGGGVTGAAYEMAALMSIEMATGWDPDRSEVIVGTSAGSFVAGIVRSGRLSLDRMVEGGDERSDVAERISQHLFKNGRPGGLRRWARHGLGPGLLKPGVRLVLGSPGRYASEGIADWATAQIGELSRGWPDKPTVISAYDLAAGTRTAFGTLGAPNVPLRDAIAASSAVPVIFSPHRINGSDYVDGGVISGTHADLVLGNPAPLDLVLVLAPMAAVAQRDGALAYEALFDRVGKAALEREIALIESTWPATDIIVIRPEPEVLAVMRPNPMKPEAAVPTFIKTFTSMRTKLARATIWQLLEHHLVAKARS